MKKIYSLFLLVLAFNSCGEKNSASIEALVSKGTLKELIAKKKELSAKIDAKSNDLKKNRCCDRRKRHASKTSINHDNNYKRGGI